MSGRSNTFKSNILKLIFNNINFTGVGDAAGLLGSALAGNIYIRLCTSATVVNDTTIGTETTYGGYPVKGLAVPRNLINWTITGNVAKNILDLEFPIATSGADVLRYFEIWINNTSTNEADRLYWGQLQLDKGVTIGKAVSFVANSLVITEN